MSKNQSLQEAFINNEKTQEGIGHLGLGFEELTKLMLEKPIIILPIVAFIGVCYSSYAILSIMLNRFDSNKHLSIGMGLSTPLLALTLLFFINGETSFINLLVYDTISFTFALIATTAFLLFIIFLFFKKGN